MASLPVLEQQAIAALRHGPEPTTVEIAALPALEQRAIAGLMLSAEGPAAAHPPAAPSPAPTSAAPPRDEEEDEEEATVEISSLRALECPDAVASAPAGPIDLPTEVDMPSLRAVEHLAEPASPAAPGLATEIDLPSLRARKAACDAQPPAASRAPDLPARCGVATGAARAVPPPIPPDPPARRGVATGAARAVPPPIPPDLPARRGVATGAARAVPPPIPPRAAGTPRPATQRPAEMPPPVPPRAAGTADSSTPPVHRFAHGSHGFATQPEPEPVPALPREGIAGDASGSDARATPVDHAPPGTATRPTP
jgi:hypothetical protein